MEKGPLKFLQQTFEPLDVKYVVDNKSATCTHVVSKKRNTSRVLQALINGRYVISQDYTDAILRATTPQIDASGAETSPLETDFEANWPDATKYPPPHTEDPAADRPDGAFAPDERRREIFDGYTFIFYERMRYEELRPVITGAKGKALLREVKPGRTDIDDFIRYVKSVAGEKGLGEFEDGSEGRGVVVVRFVPPGQDANAEWYLKFYNEVALRLDHRPIEGRDFLPAILDVEAAQLRRPLEIEPTPRESGMAPSFFHGVFSLLLFSHYPLTFFEPHKIKAHQQGLQTAAWQWMWTKCQRAQLLRRRRRRGRYDAGLQDVAGPRADSKDLMLALMVMMTTTSQ